MDRLPDSLAKWLRTAEELRAEISAPVFWTFWPNFWLRAPWYFALGVLTLMLVPAWVFGILPPPDELGDWTGAAFFVLFGAAATLGAGWTLVARRRARGHSGVETTASVIGLQQEVWFKTGTPIPDVWYLEFVYRDHEGRQRRGTSDYMTQDEARSWAAAGKLRIRFHPKTPYITVWIGEG
jgi:hypothetical protein